MSLKSIHFVYINIRINQNMTLNIKKNPQFNLQINSRKIGNLDQND